MTRDELHDHVCDPDARWILYDARGISCGYVCALCEDARRATYRPDIFDDSDYPANEPIDEDY